MDFDAIVIGGGPAGSIAALRLARMGWRTALIEHGPRNRNKTCGHCLNPRALQAIESDGLLEDVRLIASGSTHALSVHVTDCLPLQSQAIGEGLLVDRRRFDQLLLDKAAAAGAELFQPAGAAVTSDGDRTSVDVSQAGSRRTLTCHLMIGADGLGSSVARAAGLAGLGRAGRKYGFAFDVEISQAPDLRAGVIHMFVVEGGYLGVVRHDRVIHVAGLVGHDQKTGSTRDPLAFARMAAKRHEMLRASGLTTIDRDSVENFTAIGPMPWQPDTATIANQWCALVGDAAGYVEPFTGEGMSWAIRSAHILSNVLAEGPIGAWNERSARHYCDAWRRRVGRTQRWCSLLAFTLARPRLAAMVHRAGLRWPSVTRLVVEQVVAS